MLTRKRPWFEMSATIKEKASTTPKEMTFAEKQAERMKRLRSLRSARTEAWAHNHQEVVAEEARNKLTPNCETQRRQAQCLLDNQAQRKEAEKSGKKYDENMPAPDMEHCEKQKQKYEDAFYGGPNDIIDGIREDCKQAIDRMGDDLEGQNAKRAKYTRRQIHKDDTDIDYINERNAKFNKKLEWFCVRYSHMKMS